MQPKHALYVFTYDDLYSNKLIVTETNSAIEAGFSTTKTERKQSCVEIP